ncbi:hypothetical protein [Aeromonas veronii]|uniref:hypothetical protein n=1 Tax=Aeromonas veronii TaxID=654 RepID=UPI001F29FAC1|nr:hypothetical protein [Aeromonas veronii]MCF5838646.1 hypothetical protein [Aeromonas veronii]
MEDFSNKEKFELLISNCPINKSNNFKLPFLKKRINDTVQGEPFEWNVTIKNIGNKTTPDAKISNAYIYCNEKEARIIADNQDIYVRALSPNEEITIHIDNLTSYFDGVLNSGFQITPNDEGAYFETYQFDRNHNKRMLYSINESVFNWWVDAFFIQNKMEVLQSKTNNYILLLTTVTAWESLFGIKDTIINTLTGLKYFISLITDAITYTINLLK